MEPFRCIIDQRQDSVRPIRTCFRTRHVNRVGDGVAVKEHQILKVVLLNIWKRGLRIRCVVVDLKVS